MLKHHFLAVRQPVPEGALKQAFLPRGGVPVRNPSGAAPGVCLVLGGAAVICLPGVPREAGALLPLCLDRMGLSAPASRVFWVRTWGVREVDLHGLFSFEGASLGVEMAYLPRPGRVDLALRGAGAASFRKRVVLRLGESVYALGRDDTLEGELGKILLKKKHILATAESCTGGLLAGALTAVPGASRWYAGGITAYSNRVKTVRLGVPPATLRSFGAVSRQTAEAMARGALDALGAQCSVAVTGIAGPSGGSPAKPVGTVWIAVRTPGGVTSREYRFPGDRESVRLSAVSCALGMLLAALRAGR